MQLENRYIVLKLKDVKELPAYLLNQLEDVSTAVTAIREQRNSKPLECLVLEKDWPEYEPALEMLSARVDGVDPFVWVKRHECTNSDRWNCKYCSTVKSCQANKEQLNREFGRFGAPPAAAVEAAEFTEQAWNNVLNFGGAPDNTPAPVVKHSHYKKDIRHLDMLDVYRVLQLFEVTDQAIGHAIKKLLVAGGRGAGKDRGRDYREAVDSINRALQMINEDEGKQA